MGGFRLAVVPVSLLVLSASSVIGQNVISAKSGLVHYIEGQVLLDDKAVEVKYSQFPEVRQNQVLKTIEGRAEVLLTPGVTLRLAENSSFRMVSNSLSDTRVEALSGSVMIEHGEMAKDNQVSLMYKDRSITFVKSGLYRLDAQTGDFRVYQGEAKIAVAGQTMTAKEAREVQLNAAVLTAMKFDTKDDDEFYRWASRRASYIAMANVSSAKALHDSGYMSSYGGGYGGGYGAGYGAGMWDWNPYFGMFTYVPFGGMYYSPFGYGYFTPYLVGGFYNNYYGGYGYGYGGYGPYYNNYGGGGGYAAGNRGRFNSATNYGVPSRPATASSGGFSGHSGSRGASSPAAYGGSGGGRGWGGGGYSGGGYSGGSASSGASMGSAASAGGGGGGHGGGGGGGHR